MNCEDCNGPLTIAVERECMDMCDACWTAFDARVKRMTTDRDYRMEVTEAAVFYVNEMARGSAADLREAEYRAFFACVMPEMPPKEVERYVAMGRANAGVKPRR
jgi:hypothetical protein